MSTSARSPNFLFIGSAKCGSTWLYDILRAHPQAYVPPAKDVYYFDKYYHKGPGWYASFFKNVPDTAVAVGELSHDYLYARDAAERIARDLPGVKLLAAVRDPIDRAYSAYLFQKRNLTAGVDFEDTVKRSPNIVQRGRYADALQVYFDLFGRDRVKVIVFDDLKADPRKLARDIYAWLGIDETFEYAGVNEKSLGASVARFGLLSAAVKQLSFAARRAGMANLVGRIKSSRRVTRWLYKPITPAQRAEETGLTVEQKAQLRDFYRDDVERVGRMIGRDLSHWLR